MLHLSTLIKFWHCPKVDCEVGLRIEILRDHTTGEVAARKFECDAAFRCSLPTKEGTLSQYDYTNCRCPEALASRSAGDAQG
jgi:hypothetical protein